MGEQANGSTYCGASEALRGRLVAAVEDRAADLRALSHDLHAHPELAYAEHHAVAAVAALLRRHGVRAQVGAFGLETALHAVVGNTVVARAARSGVVARAARSGVDRPHVAVLAEYDALPGIGHACGHNIICATAVGAFLALAAEVADLGGAVELIGTPAEEGGGGKEHIARAGGFDNVAAAVMLHPTGGRDLALRPSLGRRKVDVIYRGRAAHASGAPHMGRNALDAVVTAYQGIAQLRQHMLPSDRIHGIITDGGARPNIVPERAAAQFYVRSAQPGTLHDLCDRAHAIFGAAATATGTRAEVRWDPDPPYLPVRHNHILAARYAHNLRGRGREVVEPEDAPSNPGGSTDLGNVSVRVPAIHPYLSVAPHGVSNHTVEMTEWAASQRADAAIVDGAIGLALTAADFLSDAALRDAVRAEFEAAGGPATADALLYASP